jgi:hypothetical protein
LSVTGLAVNTVASLLVLYPYLNVRKSVKDDEIKSMDMKTGEYTQLKHLKDRRLGLVGFSLFAVGFLLQLLGTL